MSNITLITGGARSGKSRHALTLASEYARKAFIATSTAFDEEMADRIAKHQQERDDSFLTVEEPIDLAGAIDGLPDSVDVAVIDCLTVWLGNLMHHHEDDIEECTEVTALQPAIRRSRCDLIIVTNEVGMGIVPNSAVSRRFRDIAGRLNAGVASVADDVVLTVSGIPVAIKGDDTL